MIRVSTRLLAVLIALCTLVFPAPGQEFGAPGQINYQGKLTNPAGDPLDGFYDLRFGIYTFPTGGDALWPLFQAGEEHQGVSVQQGIFNVILGNGNPTPYPIGVYVWDSSSPDSPTGQRWLQIEVKPQGAPPSEYVELTPRQEISSVPWAMTDNDWFMLGEDMIMSLPGNVGIGTSSPATKLDVVGTVQVTGFKMPTDAVDGYVLTADGAGDASWQPAAVPPAVTRYLSIPGSAFQPTDEEDHDVERVGTDILKTTAIPGNILAPVYLPDGAEIPPNALAMSICWLNGSSQDVHGEAWLYGRHMGTNQLTVIRHLDLSSGFPACTLYGSSGPGAIQTINNETHVYYIEVEGIGWYDDWWEMLRCVRLEYWSP